jgi:gas vesicle protein
MSEGLKLVLSIAVPTLISLIGAFVGWFVVLRKLPGELVNIRIKNAKEKSQALEEISEDAENAFLQSSEYRRKFQDALKEIEKLKEQIAELPELRKEVILLRCEQENYQNENKAYRQAYEETSAQIRKHGEEPARLPYIRKKDCAELVKGI